MVVVVQQLPFPVEKPISMFQQVINHFLLSPQLIQLRAVVVLVQQPHQQAHHHLAEEDLNVPVVLIALKNVIVVFWERLSQNVFVMDVFGVHRLFKENHGVSTNQEAVQQLNRHLVVHLAMLLIVLNETVATLEPINNHVKQMDAVGNQLIPVLVYHGVTFPLKTHFQIIKYKINDNSKLELCKKLNRKTY